MSLKDAYDRWAFNRRFSRFLTRAQSGRDAREVLQQSGHGDTSFHSIEEVKAILRKARIKRAVIVEGSLAVSLLVRRRDKKRTIQVMKAALPGGFHLEVSGQLPWWRCRVRRYVVRYV